MASRSTRKKPARPTGAAGSVTARPPAPFPGAPAALGIYFALAVIYFLPAFLPDRQIYGIDYTHAAIFYQEWLSATFGRGAIPTWLPHVYGGLPWFANPGMTWYPFRFLADLLLPATRIFPAIYVLQTTVAGFGAYLLARELGSRRWIALVAGLSFQFTGQFMSWVLAGHDGRMIGLSSGPLFLFFLHRGIRTGRPAPFVGASATIGFAMLSFQIQTAYYVLLGGALWSVFLLIRLGWMRQKGQLIRRVGFGTAAIAFAFALNAVNFLPFLDYVDQSPRGGEGRGYEYAVSYSMAPQHVLALAVPEQAGIREAYTDRIQRKFQISGDLGGENSFKLHTEYVGAFALLLLVLGLLYSRRNAYWLFFAGLGLFALSIAFGGNTPVYRLYYELLPGTRGFRTPDMGFILVPIALTAMAAITLERLAALRAQRRAVRGYRTGGDGDPSFAVALAVLAAVAGLAVVGGLTFGNAASAADGASAGWFRFAAVAALMTVTLWAWLAGRLATGIAASALAVITVADLWTIDRQFFETTEPEAVLFRSDDVTTFLRAREGPFRVWVMNFPQLGGAYRGHGNYPMRFGIEQASGEHGNQLQRYNEYLGAGEQVYTDYHNFTASIQRAVEDGTPTRYIGAGNIRYIVAMAQLPIPGWRLVHGGPSAAIYENSAAMPRAWLVPEVEVAAEPGEALARMLEADWDPARTAFLAEPLGQPLAGGPLAGEARIAGYGDDRLVVETTADRPALLVIAENWYPGWEATVDGVQTPVVRVNHTFQGVVVGAGPHTVKTEFRPTALYTGLTVYLICLVVLAVYGGWIAWRAVRRPREAAA